MRKIVYLLCILFASAMQVACSNDEEEEEEIVLDESEIAPPSGYKIMYKEKVSITGYLSKHTWGNYSWRLYIPSSNGYYEISKYPKDINLNIIEHDILKFNGTQTYYLTTGDIWNSDNIVSFYSLNIDSIEGMYDDNMID